MNAYRTEAEQTEDAERAKKPRPWSKSQDEALGTAAVIVGPTVALAIMIQLYLLGASDEVGWRHFLPATIWLPSLVFLIWYARAWWLRNEVRDE